MPRPVSANNKNGHAREGSAQQARRFFAEAATAVARVTGRISVFALAMTVVIVWAASGPFFNYSDTWQLVINTGTTIVTFLMVFLIQNSQNRDSAAIQVKLDEIIRTGRAQNTFVGIEHLTEEEIEDLRAKCEMRAKKKQSSAAERNGKKHAEVRGT